LGEHSSLVAAKLEDSEEVSREAVLHNLHYAKQHFSADDFTYV